MKKLPVKFLFIWLLSASVWMFFVITLARTGGKLASFTPDQLMQPSELTYFIAGISAICIFVSSVIDARMTLPLLGNWVAYVLCYSVFLWASPKSSFEGGLIVTAFAFAICMAVTSVLEKGESDEQ